LGSQTANQGHTTPEFPNDTKYLLKNRKNRITNIPTAKENPSPPRLFLPATLTAIKTNMNVLKGDA
jgi:hypothetical protein